MQTLIHTGPSLLLKVYYYDSATEKIVGYAYGLDYTVTQGQKMQFTVDSPFPANIDQAAGPSFVRGSMQIYMLKGTTPELMGIVPFRNDASGDIYNDISKQFGLRIYDRASTSLIFAIDYAKIGSYSASIRSRGIVQMRMEFEGSQLTPGNGG
jgi:hypothetical protein